MPCGSTIPSTQPTSVWMIKHPPRHQKRYPPYLQVPRKKPDGSSQRRRVSGSKCTNRRKLRFTTEADIEATDFEFLYPGCNRRFPYENSLRMHRRVHCTPNARTSAIRECDEMGRFDWHLAAVLRISNRNKMRVSVKYFDGEPPEPKQPTNKQWGTMLSHCPAEGSILAIRKWDDKERFDLHLATVLKVKERQRVHVFLEYCDEEQNELLMLKNE